MFGTLSWSCLQHRVVGSDSSVALPVLHPCVRMEQCKTLAGYVTSAPPPPPKASAWQIGNIILEQIPKDPLLLMRGVFFCEFVSLSLNCCTTIPVFQG